MRSSFRAVEIERFGGKVDRGDPLKVRVGKSPDCSDVDFLPGEVGSRAGSTLLASVSSRPVRSIKEFVLLDATTRRVLILDALGVLSKELGDIAAWGTVSVIESHLGTAVNMKSDTLFGHEWMCFSADGKIGGEVPRKYNDTNLDRFTAGGPGALGTMGFQNNGIPGNVSKGLHRFRVVFVRRNGSLTPFSPEGSFTSIGQEQIETLGLVPVGPPDVIGRIVVFSRAADERFFYVPGTKMEIKDNVTTGITGLDFTDEELGNGISMDYLFNTFELPPAAGVKSYANRNCVWGLQNAAFTRGDRGFRALSFDGGFSGNIPLGWTQVTAGGSKSNPTGATGDSYRITGDGATQRGAIQNIGGAFPVLEPGTAYRARYRIRRSSPSMVGSFHVYLVGIGAPAAYGTTTNAADVPADGSWINIDQQLISQADNRPGVDWLLRISGGGGSGGGTVISNGDYFEIDWVNVYPARQATLPSTAFWSGFQDPESFNFIDGRQDVARENGQGIRDAFVLRNNFYFVKEHSIHVTADNGLEPINWQIEEVSSEVGTPSNRGVDTTDGWAVIAARAGVYVFAGGLPIRISDDIEETWNSINWLYGYKIWVKIDNENKRIQIGVPLGASTEINATLMCRYQGTIPSPRDVEWGPWTLTGNCVTFSERSDGTRILLYGQGQLLLAGKVTKLDASTHNDNGAAINAYYRTAHIRAADRLLFGFMTMSITGEGGLGITAFYPNDTTQQVIAPVTLFHPENVDLEWIPIRIKAESVSFKFGTNAVGAWWRMRKFMPYVKRAPHTPRRGLREG